MQEELAENTDIESDVRDQETAEHQTEEQPTEQAEEYEISLGDSPSQEAKRNDPKVRRIIGSRDKARAERDELKEQNVQLQKRLEELSKPKEVKAAPDYLDYESEDDYRAAVVEWAKAQETPKKEPNPLDVISIIENRQQAKAAYDSHYRQAEELAEKFPDYSELEERAIDILGRGLSESIVIESKRSADVLAYFGRYPEEAEKFKHLSESNSVRAAIELGRLEEKLRIQPLKKTPPPEPDEPLEGGIGSSASLSKLEKQLAQARAAGDTQKAIEIKRLMRG